MTTNTPVYRSARGAVNGVIQTLTDGDVPDTQVITLLIQRDDRTPVRLELGTAGDLRDRFITPLIKNIIIDVEEALQ